MKQNGFENRSVKLYKGVGTIMGHEIDYRICDASANLKHVEAEINAYVAQKTWQESGSGLCSPIRWIDYICANESEAYKYI